MSLPYSPGTTQTYRGRDIARSGANRLQAASLAGFAGRYRARDLKQSRNLAIQATYRVGVTVAHLMQMNACRVLAGNLY